MDFVWLNGKIVNSDEANLNLWQHSLHYSGAVFEGIKVYNGVPFLPLKHIDRLYFSAEHNGLSIEFSPQEIYLAMQEVISANNIVDGYIRPIVWRGGNDMAIEGILNPICVAILSKKNNVDSAIQLGGGNGMRLVEAKYRRPSHLIFPVGTKSSALYASSSLCKRDAKQRGYDDALMLDLDGMVSELTVANVFFVTDNKFFTPIPTSCLAGITRGVVLDIIGNLGLTVEEVDIPASEIGSFDACFATGTALEIKWIKSIDMNNFVVNYNLNDAVSVITKTYHAITRGVKMD